MVLAVIEARGLVEVGSGVAAALFETRESGCGCGCGLLQIFALATKLVKPLLQGDEGCFEGSALILEGCGLLLAASNQLSLLVAGVAVALVGECPILKAAFDAGDLGLHLAERCAGVGRLALGVATLVGFSFEGGVESGDLMLQLGGVDVRLS